MPPHQSPFKSKYLSIPSQSLPVCPSSTRPIHRTRRLVRLTRGTWNQVGATAPGIMPTKMQLGIDQLNGFHPWCHRSESFPCHAWKCGNNPGCYWTNGSISSLKRYTGVGGMYLNSISTSSFMTSRFPTFSINNSVTRWWNFKDLLHFRPKAGEMTISYFSNGLKQGSLYYKPKQCTITIEIPQKTHAFATLIPVEPPNQI